MPYSGTIMLIIIWPLADRVGNRGYGMEALVYIYSGQTHQRIGTGFCYLRASHLGFDKLHRHSCIMAGHVRELWAVLGVGDGQLGSMRGLSWTLPTCLGVAVYILEFVTLA